MADKPPSLNEWLTQNQKLVDEHNEHFSQVDIPTPDNFLRREREDSFSDAHSYMSCSSPYPLHEMKPKLKPPSVSLRNIFERGKEQEKNMMDKWRNEEDNVFGLKFPLRPSANNL